jgi:tight adherence protein B
MNIVTLMLTLIGGAAIALLAYGIISMLTQVLVPYEKKYVDGAEQTLDSMFVTLPVRNILYISLGLGGVLGVAMYFISGSFILALALAAAGFALPKIIMTRLKKRRDEKFLAQLADALLAISNSLKTGYSIPQALNLLVREMDNPAKQEFRLVWQEMQLGTPVEEALGHLAQRMKSMEIDLMVASVAISRQVGGNLSEVLENIAGTIRERLRVEGRVKALTAQGKIQGIVMCLMPFVLAFIIYLVQPDFIKPLFTTVPGYLLMAGIVGWMAIGAFFIMRIVKIEI